MKEAKHLNPNGLKEIRERQGLEVLDIDLLRIQTGSLDPLVAQKARQTLVSKWDLDPEKAAENAKTVDLMEQLSGFTEEERDTLVSQLAAIQFTEGCNGNCFFCFLGPKKGVEKKYSFDSIVAFLNEYGRFFPYSSTIALYWNSDPFDYRDGDRTFADVYSAWRKIKPNEGQFISTTIPRGGQDSFIDFMRYAAHEQKERDNKKLLEVRVSLSRHNIQRVEAIFARLTESLLSDGFSQAEIDDFYAKHVLIGERFTTEDEEGIEAIGTTLIGKHDDIKDIHTPACKDGIVISPGSVRAMMVTVPTVYEPSGQKEVLMSPGFDEQQVPAMMHVHERSDFDHFNKPIDRALIRKTMLDIVRDAYGREYALPDETEDIVLKLGRETAAIGRLIADFSELFSDPHANKSSLLQLNEYLRVATEVFREREVYTQAQIARAMSYSKIDALPADEIEKVKFYALLATTYLVEMDFLADQVEGGQEVHAIISIAKMFRNIGRDQVTFLPEIVEGLIKFSAEVKRGLVRSVEVEGRLLEIIGKHFGFCTEYPYPPGHWFESLVTVYQLDAAIRSGEINVDRTSTSSVKSSLERALKDA